MITPFPRPNHFITPVALLAACLLSGTAYAANFTWIGSGDWSTPENWDPAGFTSGNTPVFSGSAAGLTSNNDLTNAQIAGILFNTDAESHVLTGNTGTLTGDILNSSANLQTINLGLILNGNRTITTNGNGGDVIVNGVIGQDASNRALIKVGGGALTLTAANTYTGGTRVSNGTVLLDFSAAGAPVSNILSGNGSLTFGNTGVNPSTNGHSVVGIAGRDGTANSQSFNGINMGAGAYGTLNVVSGDAGGTVAVNLGAIGGGSNGAAVNIVADGGTTITTSTAPSATTGIYSVRYLWGGSDWVTSTETSPGVYTLSAYAAYNTNINAGDSTANTLVSGNASLTAAGTTTINTLKLETTAAGQSLTIGGGRILRLASSGLLSEIEHDYSITGGTLRGNNNGTDLYIHQNGSGVLTISSNIDASAANYLTKTGTGTLVLTGNNVYGAGTYVTGGILSVNSNARLGNQSTALTITLNSGTLQATSTFALDNGTSSRNIRLYGDGGGIDVTEANTLTVSGVISEDGDLTKTGSGTLVLTGVNTYTGDTIVNEGTLLVGSTGSLDSASAVFVNSGGTLGGDGTINGAVTVRSGGFLAPSDSLNVGSFDLESGGTIIFDLAGDASYDVLAVAGDVTLAGNLSINLIYAPALNTSFTIIENNGSGFISGTFAGLAEGATFVQGSQQFQITYLGGTGNDVVITAVPEPGAALLSALGLGMMLWGIRRRVR